MKKILIVFSLLAGVLLTGCENFLDTQNLTKRDTSNYPANEAEVEELLVGAYRVARESEMGGDFARGSLLMSEIMSDDRFGGAGGTSTNDTNVSNYERFLNLEENAFQIAWEQAYQTIFRANTTLEGVDKIEWADQARKDNARAQALFLRGYIFFYLAKMFGTAPMPMVSEPANLPRASADEMFGQIAVDLIEAIELMPNTPRASERGRATKWAAEAILARAFLFYTGYYGKTSIALAGEEGGELTKEEVIAYVDDCVANSGYRLMQSADPENVPGGGFYSLWPYSNAISRSTGEYRWLEAVDPEKKAVWAGETGDNLETVFAWQFGPMGTWDGNVVNLFMGMRMMDYSDTHESQTQRTYPYGSGWGFGTVNPKLWDTWPANDPRRAGSIIDMTEPLETDGYVRGADNWLMETGYMQKKYMPIVFNDASRAPVEGPDAGIPARINISMYYYPSQSQVGYNNNNSQDYVVMRFADVLLMQAELKGDAAPLNEVRARVGLAPVTYSEEALRQERRWELAFEGVRWFDLLRYGLDYAGAALNQQNGVQITNSTTSDGSTFVNTTHELGDQVQLIKGTGGFFPIPLSEITKSGGVLVQTPGWES